MDLSAFFDPLPPYSPNSTDPSYWGNAIDAYDQNFPDWRKADILIMGCQQPQEGQEFAAQAIRNQLFTLAKPSGAFNIADLGNLKTRDTEEGAREALAYAMKLCLEAGKTVLLVGGAQDMGLGLYRAYEEKARPIEYVHIDCQLDIMDQAGHISPASFNQTLLTERPGGIFSFTNLGYQRYLVSESQLGWMKERYFAGIRYGELSNRMEEAEPELRMADLVSFDLSALRYIEATGATHPTPGGFTTMEACRLARYAGLGYRVSAFHVSELVPEQDIREQTALLGALLCWYFVEGYYSRWDDYPRQDLANLQRYAVQLHASIPKIDFYKHTGTGRWWMAVPYQDALDDPNGDSRLVPCSEEDYQTALIDDIPERWWRVYGRLGRNEE